MTGEARPRAKILSPFDGAERNQDLEARITGAVGEILGSPAGQLVLDYLRSITINRVNGPSVHPDSLMHLEGQRYIVSVLVNRLNASREGRK